MKSRNPYELLRTKEIIAILDGDTDYGTYEFEDGTSIKVAMPYLSGTTICEVAKLFGLPIQYSNMSRWQYFDQLMEYCLQKKIFSNLLTYLFAKEQFSKVLSGYGFNEINTAYNHIISIVKDKINGILLFGGNELAIVGNQYVIRAIDSQISIQVPMIKTIDREYIKSISSRAMDDVEQYNFDSAITKSRTLLEEVFCYVIEKRKENPSENGDMIRLFKQVKSLYNMHTDQNTDRRINTLLSGLHSIVVAIAEMRNKDSDAHGVGANRISIDEYHARLFVNSAMTMADFILSVEIKANSNI